MFLLTAIVTARYGTPTAKTCWVSWNADTSLELHQASLLRNNLLFRAVSVINGLQLDTDNLVAATELDHDPPLHLKPPSAFRKIEAGNSGAAPFNIPLIKIPARFRKSSAASGANADHAYQQTMHDAAEQRNLLLKRAYDVICNLQVRNSCTHLDPPALYCSGCPDSVGQTLLQPSYLLQTHLKCAATKVLHGTLHHVTEQEAVLYDACTHDI